MSTPATSRLSEPVNTRDHVRGPRSAAVSLVEYGDFECPYCRAAQPIVDALSQALGDQLSVTFRHFPQRAVHPHAQHAAEMAEAAAAQGQFWEMHDLLFAHQDRLNDDNLGEYAAELGLDAERARQELATHAHARRVDEDAQRGLASGVNTTPTFFIDGTRYDGSIALRNMLAAIRAQHPDLEFADVALLASGNLRIPRVKWPRTRGTEDA